jgi:hypothetical protein
LKKNRVRRSEMRTNPPIMPPTIASVGFEVELDELDELPDGALVDIEVMFDDVEDGASC